VVEVEDLEKLVSREAYGTRFDPDELVIG